jgi:Peptidase family M1 domain
MVRLLLCTCIAIIIGETVTAQSLYMSRDVQAAFKKETRALNGKPGKNYWQNKARYTINITAALPSRTIQGTEEISYLNNSPDTLSSLVLKLFMNIHKAGAGRINGVAEDYLTKGVTIDGFSVNGKKMNWRELPYAQTWQQVGLPAALLPKDSVHLSINWHYDLSLQSGREGMIDSTTYYLAYFYPRIAVYDDYNGWDYMDFTDQQEFYSDFNDYTVNLTVPKDYIVWGTGTLLNAPEVLQPEILRRYTSSLTSDTTITIASKDEVLGKKVTAQNASNTWRFTASDIPDMAFAISNHYVWDGASVLVDDAAGRRASVQSAYNDTAKDFHYMVQFGRHSLGWFSHNWPGVPYPYEKSTIVQGYADMEYPMMVNDGTTPDTTFSRFVAEHEIAHTYFPFYMGINETRYGFMDEGWATALEYLIGLNDLGKERADRFFKQFRVAGWINTPASDQDLPIITPGDVLRNASYGNNAYGKPALGYLAVKDMLGDVLFKKCLQEYMSRWHGKHPIPWDFFHSFNDAAGKNLNWFWSNWYFSNNYIDMSVKSVTQTATGLSLAITNIGGMAAPVNVNVTYTDGTKESFHQTPSIWQLNQKEAKVTVATKKKIQSLTLDGDIFMDADTSNNTWPSKSNKGF